MLAMTVRVTVRCLLPGFLLFFSAAGEEAELEEQKNVTAEAGQNVTLTCRAPNINIIVVEWIRADLGSEYVLSYRDGQFDAHEQHPSFKKRVELQDKQMKDGDVSLILKNVTINDTGTYECRVAQGTKEPMTLTCTVYLRVDPPGSTGGTTEDGGKEDGGSVGLIAGLSVAAVLVAVVGFVIYRKYKQNQDACQPPVELQHISGENR